jgi:hypothetical protein
VRPCVYRVKHIASDVAVLGPYGLCDSGVIDNKIVVKSKLLGCKYNRVVCGIYGVLLLFTAALKEPVRQRNGYECDHLSVKLSTLTEGRVTISPVQTGLSRFLAQCPVYPANPKRDDDVPFLTAHNVLAFYVNY